MTIIPGVLELENGIFNLVVNLVRVYDSAGMSNEQARTSVADLLERYKNALLEINEEDDKKEKLQF